LEILEVPGAMERPAGCRIRVYETEGEYRIEIPRRGASPVMWLAAVGLTVVLTGWIVMFSIMVVTGKPVFILAGIMTRGLTKSMAASRFLFAGFVFFALAAGIAELTSIIRHNTLRETLHFGADTVRHGRSVGKIERMTEHAYPTVRSFVLQRDPHGLAHAKLMLVCQSEEIEVGEYLASGDREWLASVCNSLLRRR